MEAAEVEEINEIINNPVEESAEAEEIVEEEVLEEEQPEGADQPEQVEEEDEGEDVVEISLGDESLTSNEEESGAPSWVKDLRKTHRETQKQNRELQKELESLKASQQVAEEPQMTQKPTLEAFDYDTEKYEAALGDWHVQERKKEEQRAQQEEVQKQQAAEWQKKLDSYESSKQKLGVKDYEDAEGVAMETFSPTQQGIILQGSENPALAIYAIGKNSQRAKELAAIQDPVKFAFEIAKLETKLKVSKRKASTRPEGKVTSSGKKSASDSTLERLEAEAEKTNDRTKVAAYKRKLRAKRK